MASIEFILRVLIIAAAPPLENVVLGMVSTAFGEQWTAHPTTIRSINVLLRIAFLEQATLVLTCSAHRIILDIKLDIAQEGRSHNTWKVHAVCVTSFFVEE